MRIKGEGSCCIREESSDQRQTDESRAARWGGGQRGALLIPASHGTAQKHTAKCLCFFFSKCGLEANFKAALYASVKGSQKLWTRKIPANTQLYTVAGSCCILNIAKIQQQGLWFSIRYCLGKPLHTLQLLLTANEGAGAQAGHAAASKWYSRYYDKTLGLKFKKKSHQLAILFSWKGVQLNKLWQTHRAMLLPLTQVPNEHIQAVRKC